MIAADGSLFIQCELCNNHSLYDYHG